MKKSLKILAYLLLLAFTSYGQWSLKLSSNVDLRTWKLTSKADKDEKPCSGASIVLSQGSTIISKSSSESNGDFNILIPANGDFILSVSYPGCNTKRFSINTQNVPEDIAKENYKPTFSISGFIMAKPFPGIDYSGLEKPLVKVEYQPREKKFDHNENATDIGLDIVEKIAEAENKLIEKFCSTNKAGDVALAKPDCPLAKTLYEKALTIIPGEQYPLDQLVKVGLCLKDKESSDKKAVADALTKVEADKASAIKEEETKLAKAINSKNIKEQEEKQKTEKVEQEPTKKKKTKKTAEEKVANNSLKEPVVEDKLTPNEKKGVIIIKPKSPEELEKEAIRAKQREGMAKSVAEDKDAMYEDAQKAKAKREKNEKAAREKMEKQKEGLAKSQAEDEAAIKASIEKKRKAAEEKARKQEEGLAKSKAEDEAAIKADNEKRRKAAEEKEAKEAEKKRLAREANANDPDGKMKKGNSDFAIPQLIGGALEKYKETIKKADELFKMKRYDEAKVVYQESLTYKENDTYANDKLAEIEKAKAPK